MRKIIFKQGTNKKRKHKNVSFCSEDGSWTRDLRVM